MTPLRISATGGKCIDSIEPRSSSKLAVPFEELDYYCKECNLSRAYLNYLNRFTFTAVGPFCPISTS